MSQYHASRPIHGLDIAHLLYSTDMNEYDRACLVDFGPGDAGVLPQFEHATNDVRDQVTNLACTLDNLGFDLRYRGFAHVFAAESMGDLTHNAFHLNDIRSL